MRPGKKGSKGMCGGKRGTGVPRGGGVLARAPKEGTKKGRGGKGKKEEGPARRMKGPVGNSGSTVEKKKKKKDVRAGPGPMVKPPFFFFEKKIGSTGHC